jgi:YHS domain-containing protein
MDLFLSRFRNLPAAAQQNIIKREREQRLRLAREKGIPEEFADANLQSLASMREVSRRPLFNQLAEQGIHTPPDVERHILGYLGTQPRQTPNSIIKSIAEPRKKAAHNAMVLQKLQEAEEQMAAEQSQGWQQHLKEQAKLKSRAKRGQNYNFRSQSQKNIYKNKPINTNKTLKKNKNKHRK